MHSIFIKILGMRTPNSLRRELLRITFYFGIAYPDYFSIHYFTIILQWKQKVKVNMSFIGFGESEAEKSATCGTCQFCLNVKIDQICFVVTRTGLLGGLVNPGPVSCSSRFGTH